MAQQRNRKQDLTAIELALFRMAGDKAEETPLKIMNMRE